MRAQHIEAGSMLEKMMVSRARQAKREGKAPTTQARAFVEEEMKHLKRSKHRVELSNGGHCHRPLAGSQPLTRGFSSSENQERDLNEK